MLNKKILLGVATVGLSALVAVNASAALPGAYVGGTLGWGDVHQGGFPAPAFDTKSDDTGIAGRLFGGYQFDDTWGAELGWSRFSNATAKGKLVRGFGPFYSVTNLSGTIKTDAFDLVGKATLPIQDGFSVYGKAGIAYLYQRADVSISGGALVPSGVLKGSDNEHRIFPTFTVGTSYDITPNVVADLSWNRIQKVGSSDLSSTDLVGVGLSYSFG